jgi:hypothetical protein
MVPRWCPGEIFGALIPKGAKNVTVAEDFLKYAVQPSVLNEYLKAGRGRWLCRCLRSLRSTRSIVLSFAMLDVMNNGMTPEQAVDKAFRRAEEIFR